MKMELPRQTDVDRQTETDGGQVLNLHSSFRKCEGALNLGSEGLKK